MMKTTIIILCAVLFIYPLNCYAAGTLVVEAVGDGRIYEDSISGKLLAKGCLVQVLLDREGDGLDPIGETGSIYPAGDDVLLPVLSGSNTFFIGDGLPPFAGAGQFSAVVTFDNEDPAPNYSGYRVYIRYWNDKDPDKGSMYGQAGPYILQSGLKPNKINVVADYDLDLDRVLP